MPSASRTASTSTPSPTALHSTPYSRPQPPPRQLSDHGPKPRARRVIIACQPCRDKRSKCDGGRPCSMCTQNQRDCMYGHSERRVWISQSDYLHLLEQKDELQRRCDALSLELRQAGQQSGVSTLSPQRINSVDTGNPLTEPVSQSPSLEVEEDESREGRGRLLTDERGVSRFMGDCSGAAFYSALMDTLPSILPDGISISGPHPSTSYQTWDSRPLPLSIVDPYTLPPSYLTKHLVSIFFQHLSDTFHFLDQATFKAAIQNLYGEAGDGTGSADGSDVWTLAQLYIVLAIASLHVSSPSGESHATEEDLLGLSLSAGQQEFPGMGYFARVNVLLSGFPERSSLSGAQTLALVAYYLLSVCHRDAAYAYIGGAMRMAVSLGLHQMHDERTLSNTSSVFWTIYALDRLISSTLGRPVQVMDDDILTPRPSDMGLSFNVRIGQVQTVILSELYIVSRTPGSRLYSLVKAAQLLGDAQLLSEDLRKATLTMQNPRSEIILKLSCGQTIIVICRHALLLALRMRQASPHNVPSTLIDGELRQLVDRLCREALKTALESVRLLQVLSMTGMILPWCFFDCHVAYNAGIVLVISTLLDPTSSIEVDHGIQLVFSILEFMSNRGNESAGSCKSILETLSVVRPLVQFPIQDSIQSDGSNLDQSSGLFGPNDTDLFSIPDNAVNATSGTSPYLTFPVVSNDDRAPDWDAFLQSIGMSL